jgi:hypothetical protein
MVMAGIQAALIVGLRILKFRHVEWPMILMAVLAAALLAAGVLRHYWDIWVHRTVRGISFVFVGIDAAGDLFSLISVFFQPTLDILGMVIYGTELVLWLGVFVCGGYYNLLPWIRKRQSPDESRHAQDSGPHHTGSTVGTIALHDLPSSTSVFRTASREPDGLRPRLVTSLRRGSNGQEEESTQTDQ